MGLEPTTASLEGCMSITGKDSTSKDLGKIKNPLGTKLGTCGQENAHREGDRLTILAELLATMAHADRLAIIGELPKADLIELARLLTRERIG